MINPDHHWRIPPRNQLFSGRDEVLDKLHQHLFDCSGVALTGLSGVGKTQVAIEYAHRYRNSFRAGFFVRADTKINLTSDLIGIAVALGLPESVTRDQGRILAAVQHWWRANDQWLLIADNADELAVVKGLLPIGGPGYLLLTTQEPATHAVARPMLIREMNTTQGADLLMRRNTLSPLSVIPDDDHVDARILSDELGGLPLALEQAAAFIHEMNCKPADYLNLYRQEITARRLRIWQSSVVPDEHPSVTTTFSLAYKKVEVADPTAADLLRLCTFLAPEHIPEFIFTQVIADCSPSLAQSAADEMEWMHTIRAITRFSLILRDPNNRTLTIHRQVQAVMHDTMIERGEASMWLEHAGRLLLFSFPYAMNLANWPACESLLPHLLTCARWLDKSDVDAALKAGLFNKAGVYLDERSRHGEAEPLHRCALEIYDGLPDVPPLLIAMLNHNLGESHRRRADLAQAELYLRRALDLRRKELGHTHPDTLSTWANLGLTLCDTGKPAEAEVILARVLDEQRKKYGAKHLQTATALHNLAYALKARECWEQAEPLFRSALNIYEKHLGANNPLVANTLNELAHVYWNSGRESRVEALMRRALVIRQNTLGELHIDTATSYNNLGSIISDQGNPSLAEPFVRKAIQICEELGDGAAFYLQCWLTNLANILDLLGQHHEADAQRGRAKKTFVPHE